MSAAATETPNTNDDDIQKQLENCQEEKARCTESNSAYAKDIAQHKKEKTELATKNEEYKSKIATLDNKLKEAESIVKGYVGLEEAANSFYAAITQFKSKKETFIGSLSTGASVSVIIAIVIGACLVVAWFIWRNKSVASRKDDDTLLSDISE